MVEACRIDENHPKQRETTHVKHSLDTWIEALRKTSMETYRDRRISGSIETLRKLTEEMVKQNVMNSSIYRAAFLPTSQLMQGFLHQWEGASLGGHCA
jgi:hypothetical protein